MAPSRDGNASEPAPEQLQANRGGDDGAFFPKKPSGRRTAKRGINATSAEATLEPVVSKLERFALYNTITHLYLVGCDKMQSQYRVLKIDRGIPDPASLVDICQEDPVVYSPQDMLEMLEMIHEGNRTVGGVQRVASGYGIVGFVKFLDCYYINLITQRRKAGAIGGNIVYAVKATEMFAIRPAAASANGGAAAPVTTAESRQQHNAFISVWSKVNRRLNPTPREIAEARYLDIFQFVDLTKDFFYSYTYDLTNSLQHNMTAATAKTFPPPPFQDMYAWNFFQTRELEALVGHLNSSFWVQPIVHGAFLQRRCNVFGRMLNLALVARRSRHFAGTRYLKRGVSDAGKVANDVEVEQIVHVEAAKEGVFSSFVQMRGSVPTFWTQESSVTMPKPPIVLSKVDSTYAATQAHFADLLERYSSPVVVLDLVKQTEKREREVIVGKEYRRAIEHINSTMPAEHKIRYYALDFSHLSKDRDSMNVLKALDDVAQWTIHQNGFFCSAPARRLVADSSGGAHPLTPAAAATAGLVRGGRSSSTFPPPGRAVIAANGNSAVGAGAAAAAATAVANGAAGGGSVAWKGRNGQVSPTPAITTEKDKGRRPSSASGGTRKRPSLIDGAARVLGLAGDAGSDGAESSAEAAANAESDAAAAAATAAAAEAAAAAAAAPVVMAVPELPHERAGAMPMEQRGVLRTNCIDSLDRTNVAQFSVGVCSLGKQLYVMGINNVPTLESGSQVVMVLMDLYSELGDHIALQYGGSEAHKKVSSSSGGPSKQSGSRNRHKELLTSIRRYYSNAFTDRLKQDAMNLFLGYYVPLEHDLPLWELDSDYYLHNTHVQSAPLQSMREYRKSQYYPDLDDDFDDAPPPWILQGAGGGGGGAEFGGAELSMVPAGVPSGRRGSRDAAALVAGRAGGRDSMGRDAEAAAAAAAAGATAGAAGATGANEGGNGPRTLSGLIDGDRMAQIHLRKRRVRQMCVRQRVAMAQWWLEALQRYVQKRMWMHLGPPKQGQLPPRFVRIHKPYKLTSLEKYFSYDFSAPIPVVRDMSNIGGELTVHRGPASVAGEVVVVPELYRPPRHVQYADFGDGVDKSITIGRYVRELSLRARSMLGRLGPGGRREPGSGRENADGGDHARQDTLWVMRGRAQALFVGVDKPTEEADPDWIKYAEFAERPGLFETAETPGSRAEAVEYLRDFTVDTESPEMVQAVHRLAVEGHCTGVLELGPYRGLPQEVTARCVAAAVFEQLEQLAHAAAHGLDIHEEMEVLGQSLHDAGLDAEGVQEQIERKVEEEDAARTEFEGLLDTHDLAAVCSTLTGQEALELYCSFFEPRDIVQPDFCYMQGLDINSYGGDGGGGGSGSGSDRRDGGGANGGYGGVSGAGGGRGMLGSDERVWDGQFARIEDDLFASRQNQYLITNEIGMAEAIKAGVAE